MNAAGFDVKDEPLNVINKILLELKIKWKSYFLE
jgi:hypothetical protein